MTCDSYTLTTLSPLTWESRCLTHVWETLILHPSYTCHWPITFQGVSHMCEETWSSISLTPVIDMSPSKVAHTCVSIFPPLNGQNPNPCGAYLASTSLILRDPSPPSCIRSQPSISSLISYKRRAPLLIFISNLKANVMLLNWWTTTFHGVMKLSITW